MLSNRMLMAAALLAILVERGYWFGGTSSTADVQDCDSYELDTWTSKTDCTAGHIGRGAASMPISNKAYVAGGYVSLAYIAFCDEYDPSLNSWASKTNIASIRNGLSGASIGSAGYAIAGQPSDLRDTEQYIPDTWTSKTDCPTPGRGGHLATTLNDKIYIMGGYSGAALADNDEYDPDSWTNKTNLPGGGANLPYGFTIGSYTYNVGASNDLQEYSPDSYTSRTDCPAPTRGSGGSCAIDSKGYVAYGNTYIQDCDEYVVDTWTGKTAAAAPARNTLTAAALSS
jgi:hypothetical protein